MSKYNYTDFEKQLNTVLAHQSSELSSINFPNADSLDESITSSEELLKKLGYKVGKPASLKREDDRKIMVIPTWEKLCLEAERHVGGDYEGYDFIHFCSLSIPVMITEVIVRLGYALKRIKEGNSIKDSLPLSTKCPCRAYCFSP